MKTTAWIAKDSYVPGRPDDVGNVIMYLNKPERVKGKKGVYWIDTKSLNTLALDEKDFPYISSDDTEPVEVELIINVKKI